MLESNETPAVEAAQASSRELDDEVVLVEVEEVEMNIRTSLQMDN